MKQLMIFRILTFILLPVAVLFGLMDVLMLTIALSNVAMLFNVFIVATFVIYVFASLKFLTKYIDTGKAGNASLRDWIRVNAIVTLFICVSSIVSLITMLTMGDTALREQAIQMKDSLQDAPPMLNTELFISMIRIAMWFMGILSIIVAIHIFINFRLIKRYRHLFQSPE